MSFYKDKRVLVTGGTGLIGRPLVTMLANAGAKVSVVSLDKPTDLHPSIQFLHADLRELANCIKACEGQDIVFQLAGVKGSPRMTQEKPASFFVPTIQFSINMMEAARRCGVERFLVTSSVGVYSPAEVFFEDDVWKTFPSENDRFAGWAKRMCELQAQAYEIEYKWNKISIVRPANVYGSYDNFDPENAMVIPSLIKRAIDAENNMTVWGDGSPIRDFIHAKDVAHGMMLAVEKGIKEPINLGSGSGTTIKEVAETIARNVPNKNLQLIWDKDKPSGDKKRLMDMTRAKKYGFNCTVTLEDGIKETINWYTTKFSTIGTRYNSFTENKS